MKHSQTQSRAALYACGCSVEYTGDPGHICPAHQRDLDLALAQASARFFDRLADDCRTFPQVLIENAMEAA